MAVSFWAVLVIRVLLMEFRVDKVNVKAVVDVDAILGCVCVVVFILDKR